jgi:adenylyltransferase/sulfurtransferase
VEFSSNELKRYDRQIKLAEFGPQRQKLLKSARVLIAGAGGLGNPIGLYLAGAGVGTIGVVDFDVIDISNLHRQVAFKTKQAGHPKVGELISAMTELNSDSRYVAHNLRISAENVRDLVKNYDLVIDGTDVFNARYLLADACFLEKIVLLHGAVFKFDAQILLLDMNDGNAPCFRCLYPAAPGEEALPACNETGILNTVTGAVGLMMAGEAIKFITGLETPSKRSLLKYDALNQSIKKLKLKKDASCPLCGDAPSISDVQDLPGACEPVGLAELSWPEADRLVEAGAQLIDVREESEIAEGMVPNAISIPLGQISEKSLKRFGDHTTVIFYCRTGKRSQKAVELCALMERESYSIAGGITAWAGKVATARN